MLEISKLTEVWLPGKTLLANTLDPKTISMIMNNHDENFQRSKLQDYIQSIKLMIPIKLKGRSGNTNHIELDDNFTYTKNTDNCITIKNRNMEFEIIENRIYKVINALHNPSVIASRLMTGDLYDCLVILETEDIDRYPEFLDYTKRLDIEAELESKIRQVKEFSRITIGVHPILDKNKTERQLHINFEDCETSTIIGKCSSKRLLIGVFLKNEAYGLSKSNKTLSKKRTTLISLVSDFFASFFKNGAKQIPLYEEADLYGY
ncbi:MAG: hypothetical protein LBM93_04145 [Oscillospiraceae bacterium]|jgi:DNA-binding Lrp family transcriptional regulator|nr:hypothetical protein [Oscillospiraceae bacterium]